MLLRRFGIGPRASVSFALIAVLLLFTGIFSLSRMSLINHASTVLSEEWLPGVQMSGRLQLLTARFRLRQFSHILTHDDAGMAVVERQLEETQTELGTVTGELLRTVSGAEERTLVERFNQQWTDYLRAHVAFLAISRADRTDDAFASLNGSFLGHQRAVLGQQLPQVDFHFLVGVFVNRPLHVQPLPLRQVELGADLDVELKDQRAVAWDLHGVEIEVHSRNRLRVVIEKFLIVIHRSGSSPWLAQ